MSFKTIQEAERDIHRRYLEYIEIKEEDEFKLRTFTYNEQIEFYGKNLSFCMIEIKDITNPKKKILNNNKIETQLNDIRYNGLFSMINKIKDKFSSKQQILIIKRAIEICNNKNISLCQNIYNLINEWLYMKTKYKNRYFDEKCNFCNKTCKKLQCGRCKHVYYCDEKCQKSDWKEHKLDCNEYIIEEKNTNDIVKEERMNNIADQTGMNFWYFFNDTLQEKIIKFDIKFESELIEPLEWIMVGDSYHILKGICSYIKAKNDKEYNIWVEYCTKIEQDITNILIKYLKEDGKGMKCKNYEICKDVWSKCFLQYKGDYLCTDCDYRFGTWNNKEVNIYKTGKGVLNFTDNISCPVCLEELIRGVSQPNCNHMICIPCFKRCYYGDNSGEPKFPYSEVIHMEWSQDDKNTKWDIEYPLINKWSKEWDEWDEKRINKFRNEKNLRICPLCRK